MPKPASVLKLNRSQIEARAELIARIKQAQVELGRKIQAAAAAGKVGSQKYRDAFFGKVSGHYEALAVELDDWGKDLVDRTAKDWHKAAILDCQKYGGTVGAQVVKFSPERVKRYWEYVNPDSSKHLAGTFTDRMAAGDVRSLRSAVVDMERQRVLEGWTQNEFQKNLQARWDELAGNLIGNRFTDAAGRKWSNANYLSMLTRTITARIARDSYFDTLNANGDDLAMIGPSGDSCPICQAWTGVIISVSGADPKCPSYADAQAAGWGHPNCDCLVERMDETVHADAIAGQAGTKNPDDWADPEQVQAYKDRFPGAGKKTPAPAPVPKPAPVKKAKPSNTPDKLPSDPPSAMKGKLKVKTFDQDAEALYTAQGKTDWESDYISSLPMKRYFGTSDSFAINKKLRDGAALSAKEKEAVKIIDEGFKNSGVVLPKSTKLYRAVDGEYAKALKAAKPGQAFTDAGFVSTSVDEQYVARFGNTVMEMSYSVESPTVGLMHKAEKEVLLNRGTSFTVKGVRVEGDRTIISVVL